MHNDLIQAQFFAKLSHPFAMAALFDFVPGVFFFVKDRDSRLIAGSRNLVERLGVKTHEDFVGRPDSDFFPTHIVEAFRRDDELVFSSNKPLIDRIEVWYDERQKLNWFLTTKLPLHDKLGTVIGLMGITRRDEKHRFQNPVTDILQIVDCIQKNVRRSLSTSELAKLCNLSERTLFRRVKLATGVTPHELMLRMRIQKAAKALIQTDRKLAAIASDFGFCDQSTFIQHFRKRIGTTPRQFRIQHLGKS